MNYDTQVKAYKFVAYSALTFSLASVLAAFITLPLMYNYVSHVRRQMGHEMVLCQVKPKKKNRCLAIANSFNAKSVL